MSQTYHFHSLGAPIGLALFAGGHELSRVELSSISQAYHFMSRAANLCTDRFLSRFPQPQRTFPSQLRAH